MANIDVTKVELAGPAKGIEIPNANPQSRAEYPYNWVQTTACGHCIELNGTDKSERIRILHKNGNFIDIDESQRINIVSNGDIISLSDKNLVIKTGSNIKEDKLIIHVVGDAHLYVEGDMHTEVDGNKYDYVAKDYQLKVGGNFLTTVSDAYGVTAKDEFRIDANSFNTKFTFSQNNAAKGGEIEDVINGNRVIRMSKEGGTFAIESEGDLRFNVKGCHYTVVGRNQFTEVAGVMKHTTYGEELDCIEGGAPSDTKGETWKEKPVDYAGDPVSTQFSAAEGIRFITEKGLQMIAEKTMEIKANGDSIDIICDNGIYLN
jgi:hypothetical protein